MRQTDPIILHIPARGGSKRVKSKNIRYIAGQPLLSYSVQAALGSQYAAQVYVNTESTLIAELAKVLGAGVYLRSSELASDTATSDQYNMDIIENLNPAILVQINPVCPLITAQDIDAAIEHFLKSDADTLITTSVTQLQCFSDNQPINIKIDEPLRATQHNPEVHICNWAITIWDCNEFKTRYLNNGFAVFGKQRILLPIDPIKAVKISTEADFALAESLLKVFGTPCRKENTIIKYWSPE